jgi:hypothetical protein
MSGGVRPGSARRRRCTLVCAVQRNLGADLLATRRRLAPRFLVGIATRLKFGPYLVCVRCG